MAPKEINPDLRCGFRFLMGIAVVVGVLSICVIIFGLEAFFYEDFHKYGGWWSGVFGVLTSLYFLLRANFVPLNHLYIAAFLTLVLSFAACVVDAVGYNFLNSLQTCTNNGNPPVTSGNQDSGYVLAAESCQNEYECDCACVSGVITTNPTCYLFTASGIAGQDNTCSPILTTYPSLVYDVMVFEVCLVLSTVALMITLSQITQEQDEEEFGRQAHSIQLRDAAK